MKGLLNGFDLYMVSNLKVQVYLIQIHLPRFDWSAPFEATLWANLFREVIDLAPYCCTGLGEAAVLCALLQ